jgi:multidrug resistance efflux pump
VANGQFLERGKSVVQLIPPQSQPYVQASFDYSDYAGLTAGRKVWLTLPDGLPASGTIAQVMMKEGLSEQTQGAVTVLVQPDSPLPATTAGSPVAVSVAPVWLDQLRSDATTLLQKITLS